MPTGTSSEVWTFVIVMNPVHIVHTRWSTFLVQHVHSKEKWNFALPKHQIRQMFMTDFLLVRVPLRQPLH
jgi:hypothetical protein